MQIITYATTRLVKRHRGTMPIILTSPHDGPETPAEVAERTKDQTPSGCDFQTKRDIGTALITESVVQRIMDVTGLSPYVVIAKFHRKFIDANRSETCAFTDPDAKPFYDEYHNRITGYLKEILGENRRCGFLFDIHGTTVIESNPADIYLGTANGSSLPAGFDRRNIFMQHGLHGLLKSSRHRSGNETGSLLSYRVSPANAAAVETSAVSGGFTIQNYGQAINSIQIEIANTIREDEEKRAFFIEDLAFAIINFVRRYAPF